MKKSAIILFTFSIFISWQLNAQTWHPTKRLTWGAGESEEYSIAADLDGGVHVVWHNNAPGNREIYYKRSTDSGATWLDTTRLTWTVGDSEYPTIAYYFFDSNKRLYVVWQEHSWERNDICFKQSTDGGATWLKPERLTWSAHHSFDPSIATDWQNSAHIVWSEDIMDNLEIFYKRSCPEMSSWYGLKRLTWTTGDSWRPSIAVNNKIHIVWTDGTIMDSEIFYKNSTDDGANWSSPTRLTWNSGRSYQPCIIASNNSVVQVVWADNTPGNYEIFYKHSTDNGVTWEATVRMSWNTGNSRYPSIAADRFDYVHVVWHDSTFGNDEILCKWSYDVTYLPWSNLNRLTWNAGDSVWPSITVDNNSMIHLVWGDDTETTPFNYNIYYKNRSRL